MREQKYEIKNIDSFKLKDIFECGQCFRWNIEENASYTGVVQNNVINVYQNGNDVVFTGMCEDDIQDICNDYFDLKTDYKFIKQQLSKIDDDLKKSIQFGSGIRILNQDLWECIISFIISANNNIPRIKKIIENLSLHYGNKIIWNNKEYYTFPTPEQLSKASVQDLRNLGLGFRDKRVYDTTRDILNKKVDLQELEKMQDVVRIKEQLLTLNGVGEKVADCIMLFSLKKFEVFPIDVWVRRVMNDLYIKNPDETKVSKKEIQTLAKNKYKNLAGIAQQYLFYWKREIS